MFDYLKIVDEAISRKIPKPAEKPLMDLTLDEFKVGNHAVRIKSEVLREEIYLVSNEETKSRLKGEGLVCYLPDEIPVLKGKAPRMIQKIQELKKVFDDGKVIE